MRWNNVDINLVPVQATAPRRVAACRCPRGSCTTSASRPARPPASPAAAAAATCARYSPGAQWRTTGSNSFAAVVAIYNQFRELCILIRRHVSRVTRLALICKPYNYTKRKECQCHMPDIKEFNILRKNRFVFNFPSKTFSIYIYIIKESLYTSSDLFTTLMSGVRDWKNVY